MTDTHVPTLYLLGLLSLIFVARKTLELLRSPLSHIPTVGHSGILSYISAYRWIRHSQEIIQEGYEKYYGRAFKVATPGRWIVVVSGPKMVEDIRHAADDELSFPDATNEIFQTRHTISPTLVEDRYHVGIIRGPFTRSLGDIFPILHEESATAIVELLPAKKEWYKINVSPAIMQLVSRSTNRLFVGLPLCRDADYIDVGIRFTIDVAIASRILDYFPNFLKPLVARSLTNAPTTIERAVRHLEPIVQERLAQEKLHGKVKYPGRPNDVLSLILDATEHRDSKHRTIREITVRILLFNFAAIHTTSRAIVLAIYYLAANPSLFIPLREEVEAVIKQDGWSKASMEKLSRLDSFLKESQRFFGSGPLGMQRKVVKDFTFSDGTTVPAGEFVALPSSCIHLDEANYPNASDFQGLRFEHLKQTSGEPAVRHQMVSTSPEYLLFGHGRHACPGRFFAVNELKAILANILLNYDVRFPEGQGYPAAKSLGGFFLVDDADVLFRARQT